MLKIKRHFPTCLVELANGYKRRQEDAPCRAYVWKMCILASKQPSRLKAFNYPTALKTYFFGLERKKSKSKDLTMWKSLEKNSLWYFNRKWHQKTISGEKNNFVKQWCSRFVAQRKKPKKRKRWEYLFNMFPKNTER